MHRFLLVVPAAAAMLLAGAVTVQARSVVAELRVEAGGTALDPGTSYVTDTTRVQTDERPACGGTGNTKTLSGPTATGILTNAATVNRLLRPVGISDKFSFGLLVCGLGEHVASDSAFWLYKVDHKSPEVGGDQYPLRQGDEVLWFFQDTAANVNTGDELVVQAPARARPGRAFTVTVWAYDAAGARKPAAGAEVRGVTVQTTDADGKATITVDKRQTVRLRATRGADVASEAVPVCVDAPSRCPARPGEHIVGRNVADAITGTPGADEVEARGGNDVIRVNGGGVDTVDCGNGRDVVVKDRRDKAARDCERVRNRR